MFRMLMFFLTIGLIVACCVLFLKRKASTRDYQLPSYVTENYLRRNEYSRCGETLDVVNAIVIHYTGNPGSSALANRNYFDSLADQTDEATAIYASSNFIVGLEGEIIACVPIDEIAFASNSRNTDSISIETCHPDETGEFNEETYNSLVTLTAYLCHRFGLTSDDVIRHYDITGKLCPLYYVENDEAWETLKEVVQENLDQLKEQEMQEETQLS